MTYSSLWKRYCQYLFRDRETGISLDVSRVRFPDEYLPNMAPSMRKAMRQMDALEKGAIANPDEQRQVGHYWLRNPDLAPQQSIQSDITTVLNAIKQFARQIHDGQTKGSAGAFEHLLLIGIGGSALGPQLVADALAPNHLRPDDRMAMHFLDNTDPDGFDRVFFDLRGKLGRTLTVVVSKSGRTPETRNGMLETQRAYSRAGVDFSCHAAAITEVGSQLDQTAQKEKWLWRFPMWNWVGGRTSVTSAVGLLPAALQGVDIDAFLKGAADMDRLTRRLEMLKNPAALLVLMWHFVGDGRGAKDMVVLPYKDRLALLSRYLQQLVMESLGKERNRQDNVVNQGLAVYGNKGSTDQHAYVQQLRDGLNNFFVTFIQVLADRGGHYAGERAMEIENGATAGDFLNGFLLGTRHALFEKDRESITITLDDVTPHRLGALIALFERAVGLYAELIDVNAYHQPGVEAGKVAAEEILNLQNQVIEHLRQAARKGPQAQTAEEIATAIDRAQNVETVFKILEHLASSKQRGVRRQWGDSPAADRFSKES